MIGLSLTKNKHPFASVYFLLCIKISTNQSIAYKSPSTFLYHENVSISKPLNVVFKH